MSHSKSSQDLTQSLRHNDPDDLYVVHRLLIGKIEIVTIHWRYVYYCTFVDVPCLLTMNKYLYFSYHNCLIVSLYRLLYLRALEPISNEKCSSRLHAKPSSHDLRRWKKFSRQAVCLQCCHRCALYDDQLSVSSVLPKGHDWIKPSQGCHLDHLINFLSEEQ